MAFSKMRNQIREQISEPSRQAVNIAVISLLIALAALILTIGAVRHVA